MPSAEQVVVVGAGHAASQFALSLRQQGWEGGITVIGDERHQPYHRPPLSKTYLKGETDGEHILIRPPAVYENKSVEIRSGIRVTDIDRTSRRAVLDDGSGLPYSKLVLATGSINQSPPVDGLESEGVFYLRTMDDSDAIQRAAETSSRAVIIGGGYIGLEVAASLRAKGLDVTVFEREPRILARVTSPEISTFLYEVHHKEGVEIHTGVTVTAVRRKNGVLHIETREHAVYKADLVVVGTGAAPATELAKRSGLETGDGIRIDGDCRTSDPDIYAIGDCTCQFHPLYQREIRLESVQNAVDQAKAAAASIAGKPVPPRPLPWFWSDQYDVKLQMAGLSRDYDEVVLRRHPDARRSFSAWYFLADRLIAVDAVNDTIAYAIGTKLITRGDDIKRKTIADPDADLKTMLKPMEGEQ